MVDPTMSKKIKWADTPVGCVMWIGIPPFCVFYVSIIVLLIIYNTDALH